MIDCSEEGVINNEGFLYKASISSEWTCIKTYVTFLSEMILTSGLFYSNRMDLYLHPCKFKLAPIKTDRVVPTCFNNPPSLQSINIYLHMKVEIDKGA